MTSSGTITGTRTSGAPEVPFPTHDLTALRAEANALGTYVGNLSLSGGSNTLRGVIQGNLVVEGTATLRIDTVLWVTGTVSLTGQSWSGSGALICEGTMYVAGGSGFTAGATPELGLVTLSSATPAMTVAGNSTIVGPLYAPNGQVSISGNPQIVGTLAARSLAMSGNPTFTRDTRLKSPWVLASGPRVRFWQEGP